MQPRRIISEQRDVTFLPSPNVVSLVLCDEMPPESVVTAAFGLVFSEKGFLMTNLRQRGWDIPGGHVKAGESPKATMCREVREETGIEVRALSLFAHQHIRVEGEVPPNYRYPIPDGYQVFFLAAPMRDHGLKASDEALEARFWPIRQARELQWVQANKALFEAALASWQSPTIKPISVQTG